MKELKNVYIETYGCSANQNNTEIMSGLLQQAGLFITKNPKIADIAIINTCIVKGPTEQRMVNRIKSLSKRFKKLVVAGCMPDTSAETIRQLAPNSTIVGSHHIKDIAKAVKGIAENKITELTGQQNEVKLCMPKISQNRVTGITQILEGCLGRCSYCITKLAKGNLFSYPEDKIITNIENDIKSGCKEIWLTSQDNAAYGLDKDSNLPSLLQKILSIKGRFMLRMGMMNPNNIMPILEELIECYKSEKMYKFLHLPLQSGSNSVLKDMKRQYEIKDFLRIVKAFNKNFLDLSISTDIIAGYPTEREEDFQATLEIVNQIKPDILNISKFWSRQGTEASRLEQLPAEIVKERAIKLMNLHKKILTEKNKNMIGKKIKCLVGKRGYANTFLARDSNYRLIAIKSNENILGNFVNVIIKEAMPHYLIGEKIN